MDDDKNPFALCRHLGSRKGWTDEEIERCILSMKRSMGLHAEAIPCDPWDPAPEILEYMSAPFSVYGGKRYLAGKIAPLVPKAKRYCEPFAGAAAVLFAREPGQAEEILTDIDPDKVSGLLFLRDHGPDDLRNLQARDWRPSKELFEKLRGARFTEIKDRFYRYMYTRWNSFGSRGDSWAVNSASASWQNYFEKRAPRYKRRLQKVKVYLMDWKESVRKFDSPDTFFYCLASGTSVRMEDERLLNIEDVKAGEIVFGGRKVISTMNRRYAGKLLRIKVCGVHDPIFCTPEHPFLSMARVRQGHRQWKRIVCDSTASLKEARELSTGDLLGIPIGGKIERREFAPIPVVESRKNGCLKPIPEKIAWDKRLFRFLGYYLSEGHAGEYVLGFSFHKNEIAYIAEVLNIAREILWHEGSLSVPSCKNVTQILFSGKRASMFVQSLCGKGAHEKRLSREVMLADPELQIELLRTWLFGDGGYYSHGSGKVKYTGTTCQKPLALQMYTIALRCGLKPSLKHRNNAKGFHAWDVYFSSSDDVERLLDIGSDGRSSCSWRSIVDGRIWSPITDISEVDYDGLVHNLDVDGDSIFTSGFVDGHNCDPPYIGTSNKRAAHFKEPSAAELAGVLKGVKGKWILSNHDVPELRAALTGFQILTVSVPTQVDQMHGASKRARPEILASNFPLRRARMIAAAEEDVTECSPVGDFLRSYLHDAFSDAFDRLVSGAPDPCVTCGEVHGA